MVIRDCRFSIRQVNLKVEGDTTQDFKVGNIRIDVKARVKIMVDKAISEKSNLTFKLFNPS